MAILKKNRIIFLIILFVLLFLLISNLFVCIPPKITNLFQKNVEPVDIEEVHNSISASLLEPADQLLLSDSEYLRFCESLNSDSISIREFIYYFLDYPFYLPDSTPSDSNQYYIVFQTTVIMKDFGTKEQRRIEYYKGYLTFEEITQNKSKIISTIKRTLDSHDDFRSLKGKTFFKITLKKEVNTILSHHIKQVFFL